MTEWTQSLTTSNWLALRNLGFKLRLRILIRNRLNLTRHGCSIFRYLRLTHLNRHQLISYEICFNQCLRLRSHSLDWLLDCLSRLATQGWLKARFGIKLGLIELFVRICHLIQLGICLLVKYTTCLVIEQTARRFSYWAHLWLQQMRCLHHHRTCIILTLLWADGHTAHPVEIEVFNFWRLYER